MAGESYPDFRPEEHRLALRDVALRWNLSPEALLAERRVKGRTICDLSPWPVAL
jgi:hypothetical protein